MQNSMSRRRFLAGTGAAGLTLAAGFALAGCSGGSGASGAASSSAKAATKPDKIIFAWEPGASEGKYENMRDVFAECIAEGAGIPCEPMTTTDYNVCIESVNAGKAHMASLGAQEYCELHKKNPNVVVGFVLSDKNGDLNQVSYHSQVLCLRENVDKYRSGDGFSLDGIKGLNYSYVDLSSTSGCIIPSTVFASEFGGSADDYRESGKFFSTVLFGGSHVNSIYNVLTGDADLCSCDDTGAANNYNVISGANGEVGAVYAIKDGLDAPLDQYAGTELVCIASYAVPAVPFVINTSVVDDETANKIIDYMCSSAVSDNPELFKDPSDKDTVTKWTKSSDKIGFVRADDSYYDDFRKLIGEA